jgi:hypothetical protein
LGPGEYRVEVELGHLGQVLGEAAHAQHQVLHAAGVHRWRSPVAGEQGRGATRSIGRLPGSTSPIRSVTPMGVCPGRQVLQQQRADAAAAVVLRDEHGELAAPIGVAEPPVGGDTDTSAVLLGEQCEMPVGVRPAQPIHLGGK